MTDNFDFVSEAKRGPAPVSPTIIIDPRSMHAALSTGFLTNTSPNS